MALPKEHVTPRLQSLPKGLRKEAEAIISKKFGLKTVEKKIKKVYDQLNNQMIDSMAMAMNTNVAYGVRISLTQCRVNFYSSHMTTEYRCQCGVVRSEAFSKELVRGRVSRSWSCCGIRYDLEFHENEVNSLYRKDRLERDMLGNPGIYDPHIMPPSFPRF